MIISLFLGQQWHKWQEQKQRVKTRIDKKIILTYTQLGPPPSILGDEGSEEEGEGLKGYRLGRPVPVKDSLAVQETSPTQQEITGKGEKFSGRLIEINLFESEPVPIYRVDVVPVLIKQVRPVYPEEAQKKGVEGTAIIEGIVNTDGSIVNLTIRKSSGSKLLDSSALAAVGQYLFTPGHKDGKKVPVIITIPIHFAQNE